MKARSRREVVSKHPRPALAGWKPALLGVLRRPLVLLALLTWLAVLSPDLALCQEAQPQANIDVLFQTSTINALLEGVYDGEVTFEQLKGHGDFGIGTLNGLDGEVIGFDGAFYQIDAQGSVHEIADAGQTPFACVTFFEADRTEEVEDIASYEKLEEVVDGLLPTVNIPYAVRIEGLFSHVKTRSVPKQSKPYPKLVEVVKHQPTFEFANVRGTLAGFRLPEYMKGINVTGYHLHFLTEDRTGGGHLLECQIEQGRLEIDCTSAFHMVLPAAGEFYEADIADEKAEELEKVEK